MYDAAEIFCSKKAVFLQMPMTEKKWNYVARYCRSLLSYVGDRGHHSFY